MSNISYQNPKQEIWTAYKDLVRQIEEFQNQKNEREQAGQKSAGEKKSEHAEAQKFEEFSIEKIINDISSLKTNANNLLNRLADKLTEEAEKLNSIKGQIMREAESLEQVYKVRAEADTLLKLLELQENQKREFEKKMREEGDRLMQEIAAKKNRWTQEEEEYSYATKIKRRKEELEYQYAKEERDRAINGREQAVLEQENYIKELEQKTALFPEQLEKAIKNAETKTQERVNKDNAIATELKMKEIEKERELFLLNIKILEETAQKQQVQVEALEKQLYAANQKSQELALKVIESRQEVLRHEDIKREQTKDAGAGERA